MLIVVKSITFNKVNMRIIYQPFKTGFRENKNAIQSSTTGCKITTLKEKKNQWRYLRFDPTINLAITFHKTPLTTLYFESKP